MAPPRPAPVVDTFTHREKMMSAMLDSFFNTRNERDGFSGSVLVSYKGKPIYEKCFGYCDYRSKDLMHDTSAFQLASVSKNFTATAILWCAEHNILSLDDTLQKYFPKLPYHGITIQDLLDHRSGLPNYLYFCNSKFVDQTKYLTNQNVIDVMIKTKPAMYARPNRRFEYCNTNYVLLASIIEKVSGQKFKDFMHDHFFGPLGMKHTFIYDFNDSTDRQVAISYNYRWQIQHDDCFDGVVGDKGVYSTVYDMFLWDKAFYDGKLLSQEMMAEAYKPRSFEHPGARNYGYGWRLIKKPDGNYLVYHNGWWHGNNTVFCRNIQDTTAIIILSNRFNRSVYNVQPVWEILYGIENDTIGIGDE
ncbi:MAG TPA: serine hydrolase domain-containing protein [Chitinophagales bacterium]|nr:serine hydrolase domain-containing protein [Chitinophagales bacterium]